MEHEMNELVYRGVRHNPESDRRAPAGDPPTLSYRGREYDPHEMRLQQKPAGDPPRLCYRGCEYDPREARLIEQWRRKATA